MTGGGWTLVVLAAGMGSRYGGLKQLEAVGPGGATLMDYSVFDAERAGCRDVVFIIRPDMDDAFRPFVAARYGERVRVRTAHQPPGEGRSKPWGTGHALLSVADAVDGPFAVVNADDCYGAAAFDAVSRFLGSEPGGTPPAWAAVGYRLRDTISTAGGVNRAVCRTRDGWLTEMMEVVDISPAGATFAGRAGHRALALTGDELVSMNMWAFTPAVFEMLKGGFATFQARADAAQAEFLLPTAIDTAVRSGAARVKVLDARSRWFGLTHAADRAAVTAALAELTRQGHYPEPLW